jgi:hypothetical protein
MDGLPELSCELFIRDGLLCELVSDPFDDWLSVGGEPLCTESRHECLDQNGYVVGLVGPQELNNLVVYLQLCLKSCSRLVLVPLSRQCHVLRGQLEQGL